MDRLHVILIALFLLIGGAAAQTQLSDPAEIDTVILASTANYPDALVAAAPGQKLGVPVLLTDRDKLPESTRKALNRLKPENVVIVGGPAVVSKEVQAEIEEDSNTTRLWGTTQIGTSVAVADYFWTESEKAVIVQYPQDEDMHDLLTAVESNADERPILISDEGTLSADVLSEIESLNATEVEVYSTKAVNVTQDLKDIGVEEVDLNEGLSARLRDRIQRRTRLDGRSELIIVAAGNFKHTLSAPASPNSAAYILSSESQIDGAVNLAENADANTTIKVVGRPDLARTVANRIESKTDKTVDHVSGADPAEEAAKTVTDRRMEWMKLQEKKLERWKMKMQQNPGLKNSANRSIRRADRVLDENSSEELLNMFQECQDAYKAGEFFEARRLAVRTHSEAMVRTHSKLKAEEVQEQVREERKSMREFMMDLREQNQGKAEELREVEDGRERVEIVRDYREEKRDLLEELIEKKREMQKQIQEDRRRRQETRNRTQGFRGKFRQKHGKSDEIGDTEARLEVGGNQIKARAEYTAPTGGYTYQKNVKVENGSIEFHINFKSPEGSAPQVVRQYRSELKKEVEDGNYTVEVVVTVDGETEKRLSRDIKVPGTDEFEDGKEEMIDEMMGMMNKTWEDDGETEEDETEKENEVDIELEGNSIKAQAEYTGKTGGYGMEKNVTRDGNNIDFVFNLTTPEGPVTQVITRYEPEEYAQVGAGEYDVRAKLLVDGKVEAETSKTLKVEN